MTPGTRSPSASAPTRCQPRGGRSADGASPIGRTSASSPVEPEVAAVVADAVRALDQAGAAVQEVSLPIGHGQRELSELWCRLIILINVATFETFKRSGPDPLADHRSDSRPSTCAGSRKARSGQQFGRWPRSGSRACLIR